MGWNTFTGHAGTGPGWISPEKAHDGDLSTYTELLSPTPGFFWWPGEAEALYFTCDPSAEANRVRFLIFSGWGASNYDVYAVLNGVWQHIGQTPPWPPHAPSLPAWRYYYAIGTLTAMRIVYSQAVDFERVYEAQFYTPDPWPPSEVVACTYFFLA